MAYWVAQSVEVTEYMAGVVRLGIIGAGGMGVLHASYLTKGKVRRCKLVALCDADPARLERFSDLRTFTDTSELIRCGFVDAVLIATPHYSHTPIGIDALENGLHVMVEKPLSVHKADCQRLIAAHKDPRQIFGIMFQQRTFPKYRKIKQLIEEGCLGDITRVSWIITDWYRTEAYYASAAWRGTWQGEGGGVLTNQCPHNLDLLQWWLGMPKRIRAFCKFGAKHEIEVEDEVTAYFEYPNGATGVFITSTGEAPGTNRLEICGDLGKVVLENGRLTFIRNEVSAREFSKIDQTGFAAPPTHKTVTTSLHDGRMHAAVMENFVDAILDGKPLLIPAEEGIKSVEIANAMLLSSIKDKTIELPMDAAEYERELARLIRESRFEKKTTGKILDMAKSM